MNEFIRLNEIIKTIVEEVIDDLDENLGGYRLPPKRRIRSGKQIMFRKKKKNLQPKFISKSAARKRAIKSARKKRGQIAKIVRKQKKSFKKGRRLGLY